MAYLMSDDVVMMERWRYVWVWEYLVYEKGYRDGIDDVVYAMIQGNDRKENMGRVYVRMMVMDVIRVFGDELSEMRGIYNFISDEGEEGMDMKSWKGVLSKYNLGETL